MRLMISQRAKLIALSLAGLTPLTGCQVLDDLSVQDNYRAINESVIVRPEALRYGRGKAGRGGIEFGYERYRGEDTQVLELDHYLQLEQGRINGPQTVSATADIRRGRVAYNHLFAFGRHFELEPALGLAYNQVTFTAQGSAPGSQKFLSTEHSWDIALALSPRWNFNKYVGIETRIGLGIGTGGETVASDAISLVVRPIPQLALKAGYYWREQNFETSTGLSNLDTDFSGPHATIVLIF